MSGDVELTERQRALRNAVLRASGNTSEQLGLVYSFASRVGASERDVRVVKAALVADVARECGDLRGPRGR